MNQTTRLNSCSRTPQCSESRLIRRWRRQAICQAIVLAVAAVALTSMTSSAWAQEPEPEQGQQLEEKLRQFQQEFQKLKATTEGDSRKQEQALADIQICGKAVDWCLRHSEFYKPDYVQHAFDALKLGHARIAAFRSTGQAVEDKPGASVRGYISRVDGSVQPYAVTLPAGFSGDRSRRWPLHLKLHGRNGRLNEVSFIKSFEGKAAPEKQDWIQLDVFGRTNNAYRWSGETDVFEALADVQRRFATDRRRITLHGFSMGGAGAWHLGMHYPSMWSSVGPGAGFVDFYEYQKVTEKLPDYQHKTLGIYDAVDYALNAFNVPVCTYGGEKDAQLLASTTMVDAAAKLDVPIKLLVGPGMGHKFHPDSFKEFMKFHTDASAKGRPFFPGMKHIRFTTRSLKYNECDWLTIEEIGRQYSPATVEARIDQNGDVIVSTENVYTLQLSRETGTFAVIDGDQMPLNGAADGLLPGVYFQKGSRGWEVMSYDDSKTFQGNPDAVKRHGLQGPIDDAFTDAFICVRGTGEPWSDPLQKWSEWTLGTFESEFDKWLRGRVPVVDDQNLSEEDIASKNLILFGDPGSNGILKQILPKLPVEWSRDEITVHGQTWSTADHGLVMIFPNPLNTRRYVVINSGHTFHEKDFKASNSWLFPRLGDVAVVKFEADKAGFSQTTAWAEIFNSAWRLPPVAAKQ